MWPSSDISVSKLRTLDEVDHSGRKVLVRVDINSPLDPSTGEVLNDFRIRSIVPTLRDLRDSAAVLVTHQSRPGYKDFDSLGSHASVLESYLDRMVYFVSDVCGPTARDSIRDLSKGHVLVLDNIRMMAEETLMAPPEKLAETVFVQRLAPLFDLFVNDAFACIHRPHASMVGFPLRLESAIGRLMQRELTALERVLGESSGPQVFVLGGAKPSSRVDAMKGILENDSGRVSFLLGGVVAKVFLKAELGGLPAQLEREVADYYEEAKTAKELLEEYGDSIWLPSDMAYEEDGERREAPLDEIDDEQEAFDVGSATTERYSEVIEGAEAVFANGPLGLMESDLFREGTRAVVDSIASSGAFKVAGGGHLSALLEIEGKEDDFDHISTGGGALLYLLSSQNPTCLSLIEKR